MRNRLCYILDMEKVHDDAIVFIYGGAFDPMTIGHEGIIRHMVNHSKEQSKSLDGYDVHNILYITNNDEKTYYLPFPVRAQLVKGVVGHIENLEIREQTQRMAATLKGLLHDLKQRYGYKNVIMVLVLGQDEWYSINTGGWVDAEWIFQNVQFKVVNRGRYPRPSAVAKNAGVHYACWNVPCVSSTEVREAMKFNPLYDGKDVPQFVAQELGRLGYFNQDDPDEYAKYEQKELDSYSPKNFPKPSVTATTVLQFKNCVLLVRRKNFPFHDCWCFPGGFSNPHETIEEVGLREVKEETGIANISTRDVIQLGVFTPDDPRDKKLDDFWGYDVGLMVDLTGVTSITPRAGDDAKDAEWVPIDKVKDIPLAFHHKKIFEKFLERRQVYKDQMGIGRVYEMLL